MQCNIYKSLKKPDTYVFIDSDAKLEEVLPPTLKPILGILELAMVLDIYPEKKLARAPATEVLANIKKQGFHLQLPPERLQP
ncbi:MAG: YcgL domain-containing protein [Gammaproteobacteria bacterium]|nr:YcgL domain-containing protein [Gammaproteobacteria bacterium]